MDMEKVIFGLISNSGAARSYAFEAMMEVQEGNFETADSLMKDCKEEILKAHSIQTELIQDEATGNSCELSLLMVHAQDHLMTALLAKDILEKIIPMEKRIKSLEEKLLKLESSV